MACGIAREGSILNRRAAEKLSGSVFLFCLLIWILKCSVSSSPNIILILVDDLGWKDLGERQDLADKLPQKQQELGELLKSWRARIKAPVPKEPNPEYIK
jgi:hypothetical protein